MINISRSEDGIIRQVPVMSYYNGEYYPHLTLMAGLDLVNSGDDKNYVIDKHDYLISGKSKIPLTPAGDVVLNWYGPSGTFNHIPFWKTL